MWKYSVIDLSRCLGLFVCALLSMFFCEDIIYDQLHCSIFVCANMLVCLLAVWTVNRMSPFFLFWCAYVFIFIGGRFWSYLLNPLVDIRAGNFFDTTPLKNEIWSDTIHYVLLFIYAGTLGYCLYPRDREKSGRTMEKAPAHDVYVQLTEYAFWPLAAMTLIRSLLAYRNAASAGGYLAMYSGQTQEYSSGSSFFDMIYVTFFAFALTWGTKWQKIRYVGVFALAALINILIGQRGMFGAFMLFAIWLITSYFHISLKKVVPAALVSLVLLYVISMNSIRNAGVNMIENQTPIQLASLFLYDQGISLSVFSQSMEVTGYPVIAYFQSFIPGFSFFCSLFSSVPLESYDVSFQNYLAYTLNSYFFTAGNGLGWTFLGDLFLFSGGCMWVFTLIALGFGLLCHGIEFRSRYSPLCAVFVYAVFTRFMMLPRNSIATVIPFLAYVFIIYVLFVLTANYLQNKQNKKEECDKVEE